MSVNSARLCAAALAILAACSEPPPDGGTCPTAWCTGHGKCTEKASLPTCACEEGYTGLICGACAAGYHRIGNSLCLLDQACTDTTCSGHGTCSVANGVTACACAPGYDGPACNLCAPGYQAELASTGDVPEAPDAGTEADAGTDEAPVSCVPLQVCAATSCAPGFSCDDGTGLVSCTCTTGACTACTPGLCGTHGSCDELTGLARCTCEAGYTGATCEQCYLGYAKRDDGTCVPAERCTTNTCLGHGDCDSSTGLATCACAEGYDGDSCEACSDGYHRSATACVANSTCAANSCPAHASCDDSGGEPACTCERGYAGETCQACYPGFHRSGTTCVLDARCTATSCGRGTCEDATGTLVCTCPAGVSGDHCEIATGDCGTACGTGSCVRLESAFSCLCTDGTWGDTCAPGPAISGLSPATVDLRGNVNVFLTGTGFAATSAIALDGVPMETAAYQGPSNMYFRTPTNLRVGRHVLTVTNVNRTVATTRLVVTPITFLRTGSLQSFTPPAGITSVHVALWGAGGGAGRGEGVVGGAGGFVSGTLPVTSGTPVYVVVGEGGARLGTPTASGAGGGYSGIFSSGTLSQANALLIAGGGGGGGSIGEGTVGSSGGNGGGEFGGDAAAPSAAPAESGGTGASGEAGGLGGCVEGSTCGLNGAALQGGGGGVANLSATRVGATYGGGGTVGNGTSASSAGGGGGYFGGGGGAGAGGAGGGGGSGFAAASVTDVVAVRSTPPGVPPGQDEPGYVAGLAFGGAARSSSNTTGGHGLVLISW